MCIRDSPKGGTFDFASSNELWRASLDVIDFMPLSSVNYSGGIIITDWYSDENNQNESIKISIRFMTNEVRSDALKIKVFNRKCLDNLINCKYTETSHWIGTPRLSFDWVEPSPSSRRHLSMPVSRMN